MWRRRAALLAVALSVALSVAYGVVTPVFNAPDEPYHFEYARFLAQKRVLPNQTVPERSAANEGFNPPLYYALVAVGLGVLSDDQAADLVAPSYEELSLFRRWPNRSFAERFRPALNTAYIKWGWGQQRNMFVRDAEDRFPFAGSFRVLHLLRLLSAVFTGLTVYFVYRTARTLWPDSESFAPLAAAVCAFTPQVAFVGGYVNNDALVTTLASASLWLVTRLALSRGPDAKSLVALGICVGLAQLTKANAGFLIPVSLALVCWRALRENRRPGRALADLAFFVVPLVLASGWYFARNIWIYGLDDPLGWKLRALQNPQLVMPDELRVSFFREVFVQRLFVSYWGVFDWLTVELPGWTYTIYGLVSLLGLVGVGAFVRSSMTSGEWRERVPCLVFHGACVLLSIGSLIYLNFTFLSAQGRLVFPVIAPFSLAVAGGLHALRGTLPASLATRFRLVVLAFAGLLLALDLYALFGVLGRAYE